MSYTSAYAVRKFLKVTLYFNVGSRCGCPNVLSEAGVFDPIPAWPPNRVASVLPKVNFRIAHRRGQPAIVLYHIIGKISRSYLMKLAIEKKTSKKSLLKQGYEIKNDIF